MGNFELEVKKITLILFVVKGNLCFLRYEFYISEAAFCTMA